MNRNLFIKIILVVSILGTVLLIWRSLDNEDLGEGFAKSNGRIEAVEIDIATKVPGRVKEITVQEGDFVKAGQIVAYMDTDVLEAQLREANANYKRTIINVQTAKSLVSQREQEKASAVAVVDQRLAELTVAQKRLTRSRQLVEKKIISQQTLDDDIAHFNSAKAAVSAARANVAAADAALKEAQSRVVAAESDIEAANATIERIQADIDDSVLKSPRDGRIQYRVAEPGEILPAGGTVLNMVDLSDVFMTFYLPTYQAGRVAIGSEARIILDAAPKYVIPAKITFVSSVAQFTPKSVETEEERQKLMFRIKAHIPRELLQKHIEQVKTGLPGEAFVRLDPSVEWPPKLRINLPE